MVEEYDSIVKNSAWEIVPRPVDKSVVGLRWIYKVKQVVDGSVEKYKATFEVLFHKIHPCTLDADGLAHS